MLGVFERVRALGGRGPFIEGGDLAAALAETGAFLRRIRIGLRPTGWRAELDMADGDAGLAEAVPDDGNAPAPSHGEGIGLSIVKRLCELLDATLEVESTLGEGTVFRVFFPRSYS